MVEVLVNSLIALVVILLVIGWIALMVFALDGGNSRRRLRLLALIVALLMASLAIGVLVSA